MSVVNVLSDLKVILRRDGQRGVRDIEALSRLPEANLKQTIDIISRVDPKDMNPSLEALLSRQLNEALMDGAGELQTTAQERARIIKGIFEAKRNPGVADAPAGATTGAPPTQQAAAAQAAPVPPKAAPLTGNAAVDTDIVGAATTRANREIKVTEFIETRAGDLNRISLGLTTKSDPTAAASALNELEKKYPAVIDISKKHPPAGQPGHDVTVGDVIQKIRDFGSRQEPISTHEFNLLRKEIYAPFVRKMTSDLQVAGFRNNFNAEQFELYEKALRETGLISATANGTKRPAKALGAIAEGKPISESEFSSLKRHSPNSSMVSKDDAAGPGAAGDTSGLGKVMGGLQSFAAVPGRVANWITGPIRWNGIMSMPAMGRIAAVPIIFTGGLTLNTLMQDSDPELTGFPQMEYNYKAWRANQSATERAEYLKIKNPSVVDEKIQKYSLKIEKERTAEAAAAEAQAKDLLEKKVADDRVGAVQGAGNRDAADYIASRRAEAAGAASVKGLSVVEADAAVAQLNQLSMVDLKQMTNLAAVIADKSKKNGDPYTLSAAEYAEVKTDPAYTEGISKPAQKKLDELLAPKLAP